MKLRSLILIAALLSLNTANANISRNNNQSGVPVRDNYQRVSCGYSHTLEIREGNLWAWGDNHYGQLGNYSSVLSSNVSLQVGLDDSWMMAMAGAYFSMALKIDGTMWAWGQNSSGQLGTGDNTQRYQPTQVGSGFISISCGDSYAFAIKDDGTLWAWGHNNYGQLGNGGTTDNNTPTQIGSSTWKAVAAGNGHVLAIRADGSLWAWGFNGFGQLGNGTTTDALTPVQIGSGRDWTSVSCGANYSSALKANGSLWTWGQNGSGQLGFGNNTNTDAPAMVGSDKSWVMIAARGNATLALKANGTIWACGDNSYGELGDGTTTDHYTLQQIGTDNNWVSIARGELHCMATKANGTMMAWGINAAGELGNGNNTDAHAPVSTSAKLTEWVTVNAANGFSMALKSNGTIWGSGTNGLGQLGNNTASDKHYFTQSGQDSAWIAVTSGQYHSAGLKADGSIWTWGDNGVSQLGTGNNIGSIVPIQVGVASQWKSIAAKGTCTFAIKADGTLWGWGYNLYGQLGLGNTTAQNSPQQIGTDTTWVSVAPGGQDMLALKANGTLWACGGNGAGQLGIGNTTNQTSLVQVGSDNDWNSISSGDQHSMAIKYNGSLWAWGMNFDGQLGLGNTTIQQAPVQNGSSQKWANISCGDNHSTGVSANGLSWTWGDNTWGQLGDYTNSDNTNPQQINSFILMQSGGNGHSAQLVFNRKTICMTGNNAAGALADGTTTNRDNYGCDSAQCANLNISYIYARGTQTIAGNTVLYDGCDLIANMYPSGASPVSGIIFSTVDMDDTIQRFHEQPYVSRNYYFEPNTADMFTSTSDITFYFTQAEFDEYNLRAAPLGYSMLPTGPADAAGISHLLITHYRSYILPLFAPTDFPFPPGGVLEDPNDPEVTWNDSKQRWEVVMTEETGLGGFFFHTGLSFPLAIKQTDFSGRHVTGTNILQWSSKTEDNTASYELQRSSDAKVFDKVSSATAGKGNYTYNDVLSSNASNVYYYRLRIIDKNGQYAYSQVLRLATDAKENTVNAAPNPFNSSLAIDITVAEAGNIELLLSDVTGKVLLQQNNSVATGSSNINIDGVSGLASGIYLLHVKGNGVDKTIRVVK